MNMDFNNEKIINKKTLRDIEMPQRDYLKNDDSWEEDKKSKKGKIFKWIFIFSVFTGILLYFHFWAYGANFEVKPKERIISLKEEIFDADKNSVQPNKAIPFKIINYTFETKKEVEVKMVQNVKRPAVGKIKIINNTNKAQKLRKETRFETPDGKIFKIYKSITIPPKLSIIRDAFADKPGPEYNLKKGVKMTIPGFKEVNNTYLYKNMSGEIASDFQGGYIGKEYLPNEEDYKTKKAEIEREIEEKLPLLTLSKIDKNQYILNLDGIFAKTDYKVVTENGKNYISAITNVKAVIFKKDDFLSLITHLSKDVISDYDLKSKSFLKFKIFNKESLNLDNLIEFKFKISGDVKYIKKFNLEKFKKEVAGKSKDEVDRIIKNNYSLDYSIKYSIFPFWRNQIPEDIEKIKIHFIEED